MKIERLSITMVPCHYPPLQDYWRDINIEVVADGKRLLVTHIIRNSDFEDTFGAMMREAEAAIRLKIKGSP